MLGTMGVVMILKKRVTSNGFTLWDSQKHMKWWMTEFVTYLLTYLLLLLKDLYSALGRIKHESERCDGAEPS